jgi:dihydrofolate reductase
MGGGISIAAFHAAGLVDRWELGIVPILLGEGIPLIPAHSRGHEPLRLTHGRTLKNGMIEAHYEPIRPH